MKRTVLPGILLAVIIAVCLVTSVEAAPAAPKDTVLTQPDGSTFTSRQWGDEWLNGYQTKEGYSILQMEDGWWIYAGSVENNALTPAISSGKYLLVGQDSPEGLTPFLRPQAGPTPTSSQNMLMKMDPLAPNTGTQPVLVLLASFSDRSGTYTAANFASSMFGASNSVKDFYLDSSFNQLTLAAALETNGTANDGVVGWLNLGYPHPNTGSSTSNANQLIVKDALIAADSFVNYASFDTNGNGYISNTELHIVVVVAGFERSFGTISPSIWAHRWSLDNVTPPTLDGKVLGDFDFNGGYAQFGEIHSDGIDPAHQATIGVMAHELGHDLTWPDLYDVDSSSDGIGAWSIMSGGSWNYVTTYGDSPALPDAWLKWYQGWMTPTLVSGTMTGASIAQAETNAIAFLLRPNPLGVDWNFYVKSGIGEYFLVENRQLTGYDAGLPGCGLLIWHIDESVTLNNNANANQNHPLIKLMQADGLDELMNGGSVDSERGDAGDPYPGTTVNQTFNYSSVPNSRLYDGADSLASVANISTTCAAAMTADLTFTGSVITYLQYLPVVMAPPALWEQNTSVSNTSVISDQKFPDYPTFNIYLADDFLVGASGWNIKEIYVPGDLWNSGTTLANATQLTFQIYADNAGVPAGNPQSGGSYWSLSVAPSDARITLLTGIGGLPSNVRLTLTSPMFLPAGRYWLVYYPEMSYSPYGQFGLHVSDTTNGLDAMVINPDGGFGMPTTWTSIQDVATWGLAQQDLAFRLKGVLP